MLADSLETFPPARPVGFFTTLTAELALAHLVGPAGLCGYYAHTVTRGVPRRLAKPGNPLVLPLAPNLGQVRPLLTQYQGLGVTRPPVPAALALRARLEFPPASPDQQAARFPADPSGDGDGVRLPGDPCRDYCCPFRYDNTPDRGRRPLPAPSTADGFAHRPVGEGRGGQLAELAAPPVTSRPFFEGADPVGTTGPSFTAAPPAAAADGALDAD